MEFFLRTARWPLRVFEFTRQKTRNSLTIWSVNCTRRVNRRRGKLHRTVDNDLVKSVENLVAINQKKAA